MVPLFGKVARAQGHHIWDTLVGVRAFTGCDIANAFADCGKKRTFKHIKTNKTHEEASCQLGQSWDISSGLKYTDMCKLWICINHVEDNWMRSSGKQKM